MAKSRKKIKISGPLEAIKYEDLVEIVRNKGRKNTRDNAYNEIELRIKNKVSFIVRQFYIPGFNNDDILQEALYALRFKAIPDYDKTRGSHGQPYPFDKFAVLCIRRHLSTILKSSFQNKKKALNMSLSLDQDRGANSDENLFLSDVIPNSDETVVSSVGDREYYNKLFGQLKKHLSPLEQRVFILYTYKYSYDEISAILNEYYKKNKMRKKTNVKSIDNALSRIKQKAKLIYKRQD